MRADKIVKKLSEEIDKKIEEEINKKIEENLIWTINNASTYDTYNTAISNTNTNWLRLKTFEMYKEYNLYCTEEENQKEIEQKERIDNIMNKYSLI